MICGHADMNVICPVKIFGVLFCEAWMWMGLIFQIVISGRQISGGLTWQAVIWRAPAFTVYECQARIFPKNSVRWRFSYPACMVRVCVIMFRMVCKLYPEKCCNCGPLYFKKKVIARYLEVKTYILFCQILFFDLRKINISVPGWFVSGARFFFAVIDCCIVYCFIRCCTAVFVNKQLVIFWYIYACACGRDRKYFVLYFSEFSFMMWSASPMSFVRIISTLIGFGCFFDILPTNSRFWVWWAICLVQDDDVLPVEKAGGLHPAILIVTTIRKNAWINFAIVSPVG